MKQAIWLAILLGFILVITWCSTRSPPPSPVAFQRIVNELTLSLKPEGALTSQYSGITSDHTQAEASWMVQTDLSWNDYIARSRQAMAAYEDRMLSDDVMAFTRTTTGDQIIVTLQRIATTPETRIRVTVVGRPN